MTDPLSESVRRKMEEVDAKARRALRKELRRDPGRFGEDTNPQGAVEKVLRAALVEALRDGERANVRLSMMLDYEQRIIRAEHENERLREALEQIVARANDAERKALLPNYGDAAVIANSEAAAWNWAANIATRVLGLGGKEGQP